MRDILQLDVVAFGDELVEGCIRVDRVPEHNKIDYQPERSELVFLTVTIALTQFSAFSVENDAGELVATFTAIELHENKRL